MCPDSTLISTKASGDILITITANVVKIRKKSPFFEIAKASDGITKENSRKSVDIGIAKVMLSLMRTKIMLALKNTDCNERKFVASQRVIVKPRSAYILFVALRQLLRSTIKIRIRLPMIAVARTIRFSCVKNPMFY